MLQNRQPLKYNGNNILSIYKRVYYGVLTMAYRIDDIKSLDELERAQAAAQAQGTSIVNYNEWSQVIQELEEAGVKSTGDFSADKAKVEEIKATVQEYIDNLKTEQGQQQQKEQNQKVKAVSETDNEQNLKATVANGTSSAIMADYMKYYHLLF